MQTKTAVLEPTKGPASHKKLTVESPIEELPPPSQAQQSPQAQKMKAKQNESKKKTLWQAAMALVPKFVHWVAASLAFIIVAVLYWLHPYVAYAVIGYLGVRVVYCLCAPTALHLDARTPRTTATGNN